ncbi:MAG: RluA family pseudouridine synthase [Desulfofustis sp.]|nr:RluA family pseudouridine synthase [Desulfofustis sp.]
MIHRFRVDSVGPPLRLDIFLHERVPEMSRGAIRGVIDLGGVHVDGRRVRRNSLELTPGQQVEMHLDRGDRDPFRLSAATIIYQDDDLLAVNKPAGINTQPTPARYQGTMYEAVQVWLGRDRRFGRKLEIGMVQRLDRDTSGVMVFSIHPRAHGPLADQFHGRRVRKFYLAIVAGIPEPGRGEFTSSLVRDRRRNRVRSVDDGGRQALTRYRVLQSRAATSLVLVELVTGRMHQIRAHFSEAGYPLIGDMRYGGPATVDGREFPHQCLHSWVIRLNHPRSGEAMELVAPPPAVMDWPVLGSTDLDRKGLLDLSS